MAYLILTCPWAMIVGCYCIWADSWDLHNADLRTLDHFQDHIFLGSNETLDRSGFHNDLEHLEALFIDKRNYYSSFQKIFCEIKYLTKTLNIF